jgi:hypothetical protein
MSRSASASVGHPISLWARLIAALDRALMSSARRAIRNDELPYFGL